MRQDVYYQREAADPIWEESTVMEIVRKHVPDVKEFRYVEESGGEARAYAVDDGIILKVQRPHRLRMSTSLEKEVFFLRQLEKYTAVNVPRVLGYGRQGAIEYTCMTRIPGVPVKKANLSADMRKAMLFELGKTLRVIHGLAREPFLESGLFPQDTDADLTERLRLRMELAIEAKKEKLSQSQMDEALQTVGLKLAQIKAADRFVALHTNPWVTHTFVEKKTGKYSGLIDFGDAYIGHPIFDLRRWNTADRELLFAGYTAGQPVSDAFQEIYSTALSLDRIIEQL